MLCVLFWERTPWDSHLGPREEKPLSKQVQRHVRTRKDHKTETAEDYVEAVADIQQEKTDCRLVDLARFFGVSHVTVSKIISRLKNEGYLESERYGPIRLTKKGASLAVESKRRHKVVVDFLLALGVSPNVAEVDAEGMEHHVSDETLRAFETFVKSVSCPEDTAS